MKKNVYSLKNLAIKGFACMMFAGFCLMISSGVFAQGVAINAAGTAADSSAMLDVSSTTSGILIPRMTENQKSAIVSPATGLMIYQTDAVTGFWYFDGAVWVQAIGPAGAAGNDGIDGATGATGNDGAAGAAGATGNDGATGATGAPGSANAWGLDGNTGTVDGTNFLGTADDIPFNIRVNNAKSGRIDRTLETTFLGYLSGNANTTGFGNTFLGNKAGYSNIDAGGNVAVGGNALMSNTYWPNNVAVGYEALKMVTNAGNVAVGYKALQSSTASYSTAVGYSALISNSSGIGNTALGSSALYTNTNGSNNTGIGSGALTSSTGSNNTSLGYNAGMWNTSGAGNTFMGTTAGNTNTTGSNNTLVGYNADVSSAGLSNATAIGYNAKVGASNSLVLGGTGGSAVKVGIGTTTPATTLDVKGTVNISGATSGYAGFTVPAAVTNSTTYVLPDIAPTAGQVLSSAAPVAGVATLSWTAAGGGGGFVNSSLYLCNSSSCSSVAACPSGWTDAGCGRSFWMSQQAYTRTCFRTDTPARVIYLYNTSCGSMTCPSGWTEAGCGVNFQDASPTYMKTCYQY